MLHSIRVPPGAHHPAVRPCRWDIEWVYGSTGGGTNHVDSASKARAIVPKPKAAPKAAPKPAPRPAPKPTKKKCDAACKKANIRAALMKWRRRVANARRCPQPARTHTP